MDDLDRSIRHTSKSAPHITLTWTRKHVFTPKHVFIKNNVVSKTIFSPKNTFSRRKKNLFYTTKMCSPKEYVFTKTCCHQKQVLPNNMFSPNKPAAQAADADPSWWSFTDGQNRPIQQNHCNFWTSIAIWMPFVI